MQKIKFDDVMYADVKVIGKDNIVLYYYHSGDFIHQCNLRREKGKWYGVIKKSANPYHNGHTIVSDTEQKRFNDFMVDYFLEKHLLS